LSSIPLLGIVGIALLWYSYSLRKTQELAKVAVESSS